jgi:hypothetical protein
MVLHQVALLVSASGVLVRAFDSLRLNLWGRFITRISRGCSLGLFLASLLHHGPHNSLDLRARQDLVTARPLLGIPVEQVADKLTHRVRIACRH